jgi:polyribonucleotide nucleotidyltransferase
MYIAANRRRHERNHMSIDVSRVSLEIGDSTLQFETGKLARQASGAVVVTAGETQVLCTATAGNPRDVDFLPLTVDVEERMYAAGKIPGSFFRREGRAGEKATLTARMIDRPLRAGRARPSWCRSPCRSTTSSPTTSSR